MPTNSSGLSPYTDSGTGAYEGPPSEVTYGAEHDAHPTGLVEGPPKKVTVESPPEHLSEPTGAVPGPPRSVTTTQHPAKPRKAAAKAVTADEVENKAVTTDEVENKSLGTAKPKR